METEPSPCPRREGDGDLPKKLELRRQAPLVVYKPNKKHGERKRSKAHRMRSDARANPARSRDKDIDYKRPKEAEEKRNTTAARNRNLVYAARIGLVDHAKATVYLAHYRSQHKRQCKRREEDYGERSKPVKKIRHFASPPSSSKRDRR